MLKHIVFFKFVKDEKNPIDKLFKDASGRLNELAKMDCIEGLTVHRNIENSPYANFDMMINCSFKNFEQLKEYQEHRNHIEFVQWLKTVITERACVDFEE